MSWIADGPPDDWRGDSEKGDVPCPGCDGVGEDTCRMCNGTGWVSPADLQEEAQGEAADYYYESDGDR